MYKLTRLVSIPVLLLALLFTGCAGSEPLPVPDAPVIAVTEEEPAPVEEQQPEVTQTADAGQVEETTEPETTEFTATADTAKIEFPDRITFALKGTSPVAVEKVVLNYRDNKRSLVSESNSIDVDFVDGDTVEASWTLETKIQGWAPPGTTYWWNWEITDTEGNTIQLPEQTTEFADTRYSWQLREVSGVSYYWENATQALMDQLIIPLEEKLERVKLDVTIPEERSIKVFVYNDTDELKGALIHEQTWVGALAATRYNTILIPVSESSIGWAQSTLAHEITHLLVAEYLFGPYGDLPTWLNEGLAVYSEGDLVYYWQDALENAVNENSILTLKSLAGTFPADSGQANLAYAESGYAVIYLIDTYGWDSMRELLDVMKTGSNIDNALKKVYGKGLDDFQQEWTDDLAASLQ